MNYVFVKNWCHHLKTTLGIESHLDGEKLVKIKKGYAKK
jgi:hypothetical protein